MKTNIYPIFIPQIGCNYPCVYCHQGKITQKTSPPNLLLPQDELSKVKNFIQKHRFQEKEIAFFGGSFTCLSRKEMLFLINQILPFFDDLTFLRISTRPDAINEAQLQFLKTFKVKTIELGVQSFSEQELLACKRGYTVETALDACLLVKKLGFQLVVQLLIGMPNSLHLYSTQQKSQNEIESNDLRQCLPHSFFFSLPYIGTVKPHFVRLYPLVVIKDTELETMYRENKYHPLTIEEAVHICLSYLNECRKHAIPVIKIGLHSDIAQEDIIAGPFHKNFGEIVRGLDLARQIIDETQQSTDQQVFISLKTASLLNAYNKYGFEYLVNHQANLKITVDTKLLSEFLVTN